MDKALPNNGKSKQKDAPIDILSDLTHEDGISREEFNELLRRVDSGLRALPATAQVTDPSLGNIATSYFTSECIKSWESFVEDYLWLSWRLIPGHVHEANLSETMNMQKEYCSIVSISESRQSQNW